MTNTAGLGSTQSFWASVIHPQKPVLSGPGITAGHFQMTITGSYGPDYTIQGTTNLAGSAWETRFTTNAPRLPFLWATLIHRVRLLFIVFCSDPSRTLLK